MESNNLTALQPFIGCPVSISIRDDHGSDQAPAVQKTVKKLQLCPDQTHVRFYFDDFYFLAVPLTSQINQTEKEWSAFDSESGLHYTVTKVQVF